MGLPTKGSRSITVADTVYRWLASPDDGYLRLIVEQRDDPGQRLVACFHYHDTYVRDPSGAWHRVGQLKPLLPRAWPEGPRTAAAVEDAAVVRSDHGATRIGDLGRVQ